MIKEENKSEYDLQLSISELLGILFKTHKQYAVDIVKFLFANLMP